MKYLLTCIIIIILSLIVHHIIIRKRIELTKNILDKAIKDRLTDYEINIVKKHSYEIKIETNSITYLFKIIKVPLNKEIAITNKNTWIAYENGQLLMKNQIKGLRQFLNIPHEENVKKVIIIYPYLSRILMYINENEMVIVKSNTEVYKHKVIDFKEIDKLFNE